MDTIELIKFEIEQMKNVLPYSKGSQECKIALKQYEELKETENKKKEAFLIMVPKEQREEFLHL